MEDTLITARVGLVVHTKGDGTERIVADFAQRLLARGITVGGLIQHSTPQANGKPRIEVEDIRRQERYLISLNLGPGSQSCSLDSQGLCDASAVIRREINARPDLLIINKFAVAEAEGQGLLQELFTAIQAGLTILTTVSQGYLVDWERLTGNIGTRIAPDAAALDQWWDQLSRPSNSLFGPEPGHDRDR